jgi:hypothetical protein
MSGAPTLPPSLADDGWREVRTEEKDELTLPFFSIASHNRVYEHVDTADRLGPISGVEGGMPPRAVFTTALVFDPSFADLGVDTARQRVFAVARRRAKSEFARSVAEDGLVGVEFSEARWLDRADGDRARAFRYEVGYPLDRAAVLGTAADGGETGAATRATADPEGELTLDCVLWGAIWPTPAAYSMAGGVYPVEDLASATRRQVGRAPESDVAVPVDPESHRVDVARVIQEAE